MGEATAHRGQMYAHGNIMGKLHTAKDQSHQQRSRLAPAPTRRRTSRMALFARGFLKHPNMVGWVLPSSSFLVNEVLKQIDWEQARVVVEYGPGVGAFTTRVLERMRPDAKLIALEINPDF